MPDFNRYITAGQVVGDVLREVGLSVPASISSGSDQTALQMWALLKSAGQRLLNEHEWQFRNKTYEFTTTPPTLTYSFPTDYESFIGMTGWNRTSRIPLIGPMSEQEWQLLKARNLGSNTFALQYIISGDQLEFYYIPSDPQDLAIAYQSRGWVRDATTPTVYKDAPAADADIVLYDPQLITSFLKLMWREEKGFDVSGEYGAANQYRLALARAKGKDTPSQTISLVPQGCPYLGARNIPDTFFGS